MVANATEDKRKARVRENFMVNPIVELRDREMAKAYLVPSKTTVISV
jgi:hypothetical protein